MTETLSRNARPTKHHGPVQRRACVSEKDSDPNESTAPHDIDQSFDSDSDGIPNPHESLSTAPTIEPSIVSLDEDSPWAKKTILCLDGGGVRGYSSLLILKELIRNIEAYERELDPNARSSMYSPLNDGPHNQAHLEEPDDIRSASKFLPCHYFDYIAGTSTGGLIAIMLGRLRMSVDEVLNEYELLSARVFEKPSFRITRSLITYNRTERWNFLKTRFNSLRPMRPSANEKESLFNSDPLRCRTIVCSIKSTKNKDFQTPFLFRSYKRDKAANIPSSPLERNPSDLHVFYISDVAQATFAAPFFFDPIILSGDRYYDAAVDLNNPSWEVINEVSFLTGGTYDAIDVLLSVGGGNANGNNPKNMFGTGSLQQDLNVISDVVHNKVEMESKLKGFQYYRLDVKEGLQDVRLNEWKPKTNGSTTLKRIREATQKYLCQDLVKRECQQCAVALVSRRIQRAQTMRWEYFTGTHYKCPLPNECPIPRVRFNNRNVLLDHLRLKHDKPPPDVQHYEEIQNLLDRGRTNSE